MTGYNKSNEISLRKYRKRRNKAIIIAIIFAIFLLFIIPAIFMKSFNFNKVSTSIDSMSRHIAVLDIDGEMSDSSDTSYDHFWLMNTIDKIGTNPKNRGILIRVNTPGGSVYYSDELYNKLMEYKKRTKRPVYIYMEDMAASGGYYISAAADKISANRNCWTGSIGVTTGTMINVKGLLDKLGIKAEAITSGKNKSMGSSTEEMTEEQKAIMQALIDESYERFVEIVAKGRNIKIEKVKEIADGRIYTASQAKDLNLVDRVCTEDEATSDIIKENKFGNIKYVLFSPPKPSIFDRLGFVDSYIKKDKNYKISKELNKYNDLIELAKGGNFISISYISNIRK